MIVEICASNFESAVAAWQGGADRIELCTKLSVGGVTPPKDLIDKVISEINIPVHVLVRPRAGNFCFSETEIRDMIHSEISCAKSFWMSGRFPPEQKCLVQPCRTEIDIRF